MANHESVQMGGTGVKSPPFSTRQGRWHVEASGPARPFRFKHVRPREFISLLGSAASGWSADNALRLSAALAYYSIFSLAPLLVLGVSIAGLIFGEAAARGQIAEQMRQLAGDRAAEAIQAMVLSTSRTSTSLSATAVSLVVMLFGASGAFSELMSDLNLIWGVVIKPGQPVMTMVREKFVSFAMVLCVGFLLLVSLVLSAALAALGTTLAAWLKMPASLWQCTDFVLSFFVVTLLFAMMFKALPHVRIQWRDVWVGAGVTAFLFTVGKFLIGLYLGTSGVTSSYGAAGSAMIILLWVYYSACIMFYGAEFTKAYMTRKGREIVPDSRAMPPATPASRDSGTGRVR